MSKRTSTVPAPAPLRWGILGTGHIAHKFVSDLLATGTGLVVACGSRTTERARLFASEFKIPKAYGSYGELLRDHEVEAVYVATPHTCHHADAIAALRNGKHVLCEKPISINSILAKEMFDSAEQNGRILMEGLWTNHLPALVQTWSWIAEGAIGDVEYIDAEFGFPTQALSPHHRLLNPALGGGALLDVGIYPLLLALLAADSKPPKVKATARFAETGVDLATSVNLMWAKGIHADLRCSLVYMQQRPAVIHGSSGTITLPEFWKCRTAVLKNQSGETEFRDGRSTFGYDFEVAAFTSAVRQNLREVPSASRALSLRLSGTMDVVRRQIGLRYPGYDDAIPHGSRTAK